MKENLTNNNYGNSSAEESEDDFEDEESDYDDEEEEEEELDPYRKKYRLLSERMTAIKEDNDRLASKIGEVGRWIRRGIAEKEFLVRRLDSHNDNFRNVPLIIPFPGEKGQETLERKSRGRRRKKPLRKKIKADPNCPKRPQNPFFQFCQENRGKVSKEYLELHRVTLSKKELTKILGSKWNEMTATEKKVYYDLYERDKAHYGEKLQRYKDESNWKVKESPDGKQSAELI
ncbi:uncharacterized protein [Lepeophtheirus salmonis]|uniref:uncharacterized protein n=1 Tax=Lepeophtheirus salmonis TaxID=72036 RepID=UPI001AE46539|nr:FACT complex subunit SSRP1-like [Lepeophtheirus salmonis]